MTQEAEAKTATRVDVGCELTILMPCLNEALTLPICIKKALGFLRSAGVDGEVLIADNGSTDGSRQIARDCGARVVPVAAKGYGNALIGGIKAARGRYVIMGDADDSYDFTALQPFLDELRKGHDLVMGNRFRGGIKPGAMPPLHRYLGNPVLTAIGRLFFGSPSGDFHCGLRGFSRDAMLRLGLTMSGMEFASEMVVKATIRGLRITEVPTTLSPDGRDRPPHLRSWRDGWRHLRFLLLFSPRWLFLYPGIAAFLAGLLGFLVILPEPLRWGGITLDVHTLAFSGAAINVGFQAMLFWLSAKSFAIREGLLLPDPLLERFRGIVTLEIGLIFGGLSLLLGLACSAAALGGWVEASFGPLQPQQMMRLVIPSATLIVLGIQSINGSFFLSVLNLRTTGDRTAGPA